MPDPIIRKESFNNREVRSIGVSTHGSAADGRWLTGCVHTPHGIVAIYSQGQEPGAATPHSRWDFVWRGRWHMWTQPRAHTTSGMARVAGRMVREVVGASLGRKK